MLVELCVGNHTTSNDLVNGANDILKTSTFYNGNTILWMTF
jgi:hypothetical protein